MDKIIMEKYAQAVVKMGVNVQEGQYVHIYANVRQQEFVTKLVEECYKAKARFVKVEWGCDEIAKLTYQNVSYETHIENIKMNESKLKDMVNILPVRIHVVDSDPDGMKGIDLSASLKARRDTYMDMKKYYDAMENRYQWVICAMPSIPWAKKVFPNDEPQVAFEKLEKAILSTTRIDENAMIKENFTINELQERLRDNNIMNLGDVEYAILETSGQINVIQKPNKRNTIPEDFGINPEYEGIPYDLVVDGKIMKQNLEKIGKDYNWLLKQIDAFGIKPEDTLIATIDGKGQFFCQKKEAI